MRLGRVLCLVTRLWRHGGRFLLKLHLRPRVKGQVNSNSRSGNQIPLKEVLSTLLREGEGRQLFLLHVQLLLSSRLFLPHLIPIRQECFGDS